MDDASFNQRNVPGIIFNSLPKAGTNLVTKALNLMPGITRAAHSDVRAADGIKYPQETLSPADSALVGIATPLLCPLVHIKGKLDLVNGGQFSVWHVPYSSTVRDLLIASGRKLLLSIRDPRDIVVSQYFYALAEPQHLLRHLAETIGKDSFIELMIRGLTPAEYDGKTHTSIANRVAQVALWQDNTEALIVRFEDIVGPMGDGSADVQRTVLKSLCAYTGIRCADAHLNTVAERLHGGTKTFREGKAGGWRQHFSPSNQALFERLCGHQLARFGYE